VPTVPPPGPTEWSITGGNGEIDATRSVGFPSGSDSWQGRQRLIGSTTWTPNDPGNLDMVMLILDSPDPGDYEVQVIWELAGVPVSDWSASKNVTIT
jgi:hypothetical protein